MVYPPPFPVGVLPEGNPIMPPGMALPPQPLLPVPAAPAVGSCGGFFDTLAEKLSAPERDLADAVLAFLRNWDDTHEDGSKPNLVHVGADKAIRECKVLVLPREVSLKAWIKQRLSSEVNIDGKNVLLVKK